MKYRFDMDCIILNKIKRLMKIVKISIKRIYFELYKF